MRQAGYTQGNWMVGKPGGCVVSDVGQDYGHSNNDEGTRKFYGGCLIADTISFDADAHLIAAAPDLYEAVTDLLARLDSIIGSPAFPDIEKMAKNAGYRLRDEEGWHKSMANARSAVAKARGEL